MSAAVCHGPPGHGAFFDAAAGEEMTGRSQKVFILEANSGPGVILRSYRFLLTF